MNRTGGLAPLKRALSAAAVRSRAGSVAWFKTGKGEYAEFDEFLGVSVPAQRAIAGKYLNLELDELERLLESRIHEHRYTALLILVAQYERGDESTKRSIFDFYLRNTHWVNNWDLVDTSAPYIVGEHLNFRSRWVLYRLASSSEWWVRRIAIVATATFIDRGDLKDTFAIANRLLADKHDLIQKATGWMLREAGKHSRVQLIGFLKLNYSRISRTTLRYAVEHLPETQRNRALRGSFG